MVSNTEKLNNLRNNALMSALNALVVFTDPTNMEDCDVPAEVREAAKSYLESWVAGPLSAALRMKDLGAWEREPAPKALAYLDLLDELDKAYAGRS